MANGQYVSRTQRRQHFDSETRLALLEDDADEVIGRYEAMKDELRAIKNRMTGVLVSLTTGAVLMALNLWVNRPGLGGG